MTLMEGHQKHGCQVSPSTCYLILLKTTVCFGREVVSLNSVTYSVHISV